MGKLLILSITDGEEQLLDKLKDFLAEAPGIEIVEPPATKHTLTFPGLELHLRKQTVKWRGRSLHLTHLEFFTLAYLARRPWLGLHAGTDLRGRMARVPGALRRGRGQHHQPAPPEDGAGQPHPHGTPTAAISSSCLHNLRSLFRKNAVILYG